MQTVTPGASGQGVTPIADGTRHFSGDWESVDEQAALSAPSSARPLAPTRPTRTSRLSRPGVVEALGLGYLGEVVR